MARIKAAPYRVGSFRGRAQLDYTSADGTRVRVMLDVPYAGKSKATPAQRGAAYEAAEAEFRRLTNGRIVAPDAVVKTTRTLPETYALFLEQFELDGDEDENTRKRKQATLIVRRAYGRNMLEWASDEATRPDDSKRWRGDARTPLQRLCDEGGPTDYLLFRLTRVVRKTMRKEKSNLAQFLLWLKANGYVTKVPTVELPQGKGRPALKSGRGVDINLTAEESARIVAVMPEWSSRKALNGGERFLVRPFFQLMWLTGLRPVTIMRLTSGVGGSWSPGSTHLALKDEDDKALYGRRLPLSADATDLLEKYAPESGPIFGHHDFRKHVAEAAAKVLDPARAALFGSYHLRHFLGTFLASRTTNLAAAGFVLGHTDLSTTSGYVHAREAEAAELVKATAAEQRRVTRAAAKWARSLDSANNLPTSPRRSRKTD